MKILKRTRCGGVEPAQADPENEDEGRKEEGRDKGTETMQNEEASRGSQGDSGQGCESSGLKAETNIRKRGGGQVDIRGRRSEKRYYTRLQKDSGIFCWVASELFLFSNPLLRG